MGDILPFKNPKLELIKSDDIALILNNLNDLLKDLSIPGNEFLCLYMLQGVRDYFEKVDHIEAMFIVENLSCAIRLVEKGFNHPS